MNNDEQVYQKLKLQITNYTENRHPENKFRHRGSTSPSAPRCRRSLEGDNPSFSQKNEIWNFQLFSFGGCYQTPKLRKNEFDGDLTSIMVTRDFFGTATTTRFALTRQGNGCGVDGNHDVGDRG